MTETEREKKNYGGKREQITEEKKRAKSEEHPPFRWVSWGGDFYYETRVLETNLTRRGLSHVAYNLIWLTV